MPDPGDIYRIAAGATDRRGKAPMPPSGQPVVPRSPGVKSYPAAAERSVGPTPHGNPPVKPPSSGKGYGLSRALAAGQPVPAPAAPAPGETFGVGPRMAYPPGTMKYGKPPLDPLGAAVGAPPPPETPFMARPTQLGNKGLLGRLSASIGNSFGRTNPPLSPSSGFSQPGGTPNVAPPTPTAPGTQPLISQPSMTPYQAAGGGPFQRPFNAAAPPTSIGGFGNAPPAPPAPAAPAASGGASAAPVSPQAGPWGNVSSSGQAGVPYGAPPPAPAPQSLGQRVMGGLGNIKQAGVRGSLKAVGKGVAKGTVLNPAWVASMGINAAHHGAGVDDILRGPGGVGEGSVSIGQGMSNLAHAVPGVGGATGTAWDWTLGALVNAASNLGDVTAMGVSAPSSARARQDLSRAGSTLGQSASNAWHGRTAPPPQESHESQTETHGVEPDEQMKWLMSLPSRPGGDGEGPIVATSGVGPPAAAQRPPSPGPSSAASQPQTIGEAARALMNEPHAPSPLDSKLRIMSMSNEPMSQHRQATATLATQAPKTGGDSAAVLQPGTTNAPPSPSAGGDPLDGMLSDQLMNAMRTPFSPPFPADAFDGVELGNAPGHGGFARHMAMVNAQAAANHNQGLGQSYDMLMGYRQHQAAMANAQAQQQLAQANSMGEAMRGRAALMQADPLGGYLGNPAGAHILEQQFPGLRESMQFPESLAAPGGAELMRKPDVSADEAMAWDQLMHRSGQGDHHHGMLRGLLARRLGAEGLESSRKPGWFGMGGERASMVDEWLKQHLGL